MKEAADIVTGDEIKKAEGRTEHGGAVEEAKQREKTGQAEAKAAEKERDKHDGRRGPESEGTCRSRGWLGV
jgi:hypothetical protein